MAALPPLRDRGHHDQAGIRGLPQVNYSILFETVCHFKLTVNILKEDFTMLYFVRTIKAMKSSSLVQGLQLQSHY